MPMKQGGRDLRKAQGLFMCVRDKEIGDGSELAMLSGLFLSAGRESVDVPECSQSFRF